MTRPHLSSQFLIKPQHLRRPSAAAAGQKGIFRPALGVALALCAPAAFAASTDTWVGGSGNNFSTTANWTYSSGSGPVASGDLLLFSGNGSATPINDLTGLAFAGLSFSGSKAYTVSGNDFTLGSGNGITNSTTLVQTINNNIALAGNGVLNPSGGSSAGITLAGNISGSGSLTKSGASGSVLTLSGANTFSGALNLNAGTVNFTTPPSPSGGNLGNPSAINYGGNSTTTLVPSSTAGSVTISYPTLSVSGTSTAMFKSGAAAGTTFEIAAKVTGTGNCKQNSPTTAGAIVRFSNDNNDYTGNFAMAAGIVEFTSVANGGSASSLGAGSTAYVIANSSSAATFRYVGANSTSTTRPIDWQGTGGGLTLESSGSGSVQFLASGNFKSGSGAATLTLRGSNAGANTLGQALADSGGALTLAKSDAGTWLLSGANAYSGSTTINAGTLQLSGSGTLGSAAGALTLAGGTLDLGGTSQAKGAVTISGASALQNGTLSGSSFSATLASGTAIVSANLAGSGALAFTGAGTLALFGANTYGGGTTLGAGTLLLASDAGLGDASGGLTFGASGILAATNNAAAVNNPVTLGSARTLTVNSGVTANFSTPDTNSLIITAKITGPGSVTRKSSSYSLGTVRFSNDTSDYTGDFTAGYGNTEFTSVAEQGTPSSLGAGDTASGGQINLNNGASSGTLRYVGPANSATHRPLSWTGTSAYTLEASGSGSVQYLAPANLRAGAGGAITLTLRGSSTGPNTLAQVVADLNGVTSLTKNDAGTWALTGANSYSGSTTVNGGTLLLNGSLSGAGAVTVQNTATLGGTGTIAGVVTVKSGGTLAPGAGANTPGTLTLQASPALGGVLAMDINKSGSTLTSDQLALGTHSLTFGGTLAVTATGAPLAAGDRFQLFSAGAYSGSFATVTLPELGAGLAWDTSSLAVDGTLRVLSLGSAPAVAVLPASTNVECGASVTLATASSGSPAPTFQWYDNTGNPIPNASAATLTLTNVHAAQNGPWTVVASNSLGAATNAALLTVSDSTPPTLACPSDIAIVTREPAGANVSFSVSATDACDSTPVVVSIPPSGSFFAAGTNTVISTATDSSGNTNSCSFQVVVDRAPMVQTNLSAYLAQDKTLALDLSNLLSVVADPDYDALTVAEASATSTNGGSITLTSTNITYQPLAGFVGADLFSYVVADGRGGLATNTVVLNVLSTNEFIVTVTPATTNAECASSVSFAAETAATAPVSFQWYDNAGAPILDGTNASLTLAAVHAAQNGSWTVVMTTGFTRATNAASLNVVDTTAPVITLNGTDPIVLEAGSQFTDPGVTALDACAGPVMVTASGSVETNRPGTYTLTYTAGDSSGNVSHATRTVSVVDTTPPVLTCPSDIAIVTTAPAGANVSFAVTATDTADPAPVVVSTPPSGSFFAAGTNTVVSTAKDSSGNTSSCSFQVVVDRAPLVQTNLGAYLAQDKTLALDLSNLLSVVSDPDYDALTVAEASATSTNGGTVTVTSTNVTYQPVAGFVGNDLFSYVVADGRGGTATNTVVLNVLSTNEFIVTVTPATTNAECASAVSFTAETAATAPVSFQWYDNAGAPIPDATNGTLTLAGVHVAQNGSWTVVMTTGFTRATNSASLNVVDTTAPVITLNGTDPIVLEAGSQFTDPGVTAQDACAGPVMVTASGSVETNRPGTYTLTYTAGDSSGNVSHATRTVSVVDTTAPVIVYCFTNLTLSATATNCLALLPDLTGTNYFVALDTVSSSVTVTQTPPTGSWLALGTNAVVLTAVDASGNAASSTNTVVVTDTTPPVLTLLGAASLTNECHAPFSDPGAWAEDNCSGVIALATNGLVNADALGAYTLQYVATDASGNASTNTRTVYVVDTTAPVLTCPSDIAIVTTAPAGANVSFVVTAADTADPAPVVVSIPPSGSFFAAGTNTVVSTATDSSGNTSSCSFQVVVDRAPLVQTNLSAYLAQNQTLSLSVAHLLAVASDLDNDALSVAAAEVSSTHGGLTTLTSTGLTYLPATNFVGADQFSYTISDGRGGLATNTVVVSVLSSNGLSPNVVYGPVLDNGQFVARFAGIPGYTYTLEAADNLLNPVWTKVANLTASPSDQEPGLGIFEFRDDSTAADRKFYRTVYPSY